MILFLPTEGLGCRCPTKRSSPPIKHLLYMLDQNDSNLRLNIHLRWAYLSAICSTFFLLEVCIGHLIKRCKPAYYQKNQYNHIIIRDQPIPIAVRAYCIPQSSRKHLQYNTIQHKIIRILLSINPAETSLSIIIIHT